MEAIAEACTICAPQVVKLTVAGAGHAVATVLSTAVALHSGYKTIGSPHTTLQDTWEKLHNIKDYLATVTDERRQKIEAAAQKRHCKSLADIEVQFQEYVPLPGLCLTPPSD